MIAAPIYTCNIHAICLCYAGYLQRSLDNVARLKPISTPQPPTRFKCPILAWLILLICHDQQTPLMRQHGEANVFWDLSTPPTLPVLLTPLQMRTPASSATTNVDVVFISVHHD